ncbi:MAG: glycine zipper family protein [bacterium]|nr:glycine zipper family protein [bacterium]
MKNKNFRNFISYLLIFVFVFSPFFTLVPKTYAQPATNYGVSGSYGASGSTSSTSGYLRNIAPIAARLPGCQGNLGGVVKNLFRKNKVLSALKNEQSEGEGKVLIAEKDLSAATKEALDVDNDIGVSDEESRKKLTEVKESLAETNEKIKNIEQIQACTNSIGKVMVKLMIQKFTLASINWINNGRDGKPFFLQDPKGYFKDLAKKQIILFNAEISDRDIYPFGPSFIRKTVRTYQNKFADNAAYSLDKLIKQTSPEYSAKGFQQDFSEGGWDAWLYMTQISANNPLGFYILAGNELQRRKDEGEQEVSDALDRGDGFLGDERCADPKGVTRESEFEAAKEGIKDAKGNIIGVCKRWEYVTPGSSIAAFANEKLKYQDTALLQADDLNTAIAAIIDATINKFSSSLQIDGLAGFSTEGRDGSYVVDDQSFFEDTESSGQDNDFSKFQLGTQWLLDNPEFNLRTDLTQAIIDEQRTYKEKLKEQNKVLTDLNTTIHQLDYCIPGPHPGWEQDSREVLDAVENTIVSKTPADFEEIEEAQILNTVKTAGSIGGAAIGASIGSVVPGLGTAIGAAIGLVFGLIIDSFSGLGPEEKLAWHYALIVRSFTGIKLDSNKAKNSRITNKQEVTNAFDTILLRYAEKIRKYYPTSILPRVAPSAKKEFIKSIGYKEIISENETKIIAMDAIIKRLGKIKDTIDDLNETYNKSQKTQSDEDLYEQSIKPLFGEFSRISNNMVTGDDIAEIDSLAKQARDEIKYVYEDLLTGPAGCEQDLQYDRQHDNIAKVYGSKSWIYYASANRREYPFPIWYDYANFAPGEEYPIPKELLPYITKTTVNKRQPDIVREEARTRGVTIPGKDGDYGPPNFLTSVWFDFTETKDDRYFDEERASCKSPYFKDPTSKAYVASVLDCIIVSDLFREVDKFNASAGRELKYYTPNFTGKDVLKKNLNWYKEYELLPICKDGGVCTKSVPPIYGNYGTTNFILDIKHEYDQPASFEATIGIY